MGLKVLTIQWTDPAEEQLDRLLSYIEVENPEAATRLWTKVMDAIEQAASYPEMAGYVPELGRTYRELLSVRPFRVIYRVEGKLLRILTVMRQEQVFDPLRFLEP